MKIFRFIFSLLITFALLFGLIHKFEGKPRLGNFIDPFHGFWQNAENKNWKPDDELKIEGLSDEVKVVYDDRLVPHIFANNEHDLYFAQGYIVAAFRLWQMDFQTRAAAGRISEIIGDKALDYDLKQRRLGLPWAAKKSVESFSNDETTMNMLNAFSDGVNAYIDQLNPRDYPIEYKLLDYAPEHWSPYKSALLLKYMADMLTGYEQDFELTNAYKILGKENFDLLYPDRVTEADPIIPSGTEWNFDPLPSQSSADSFPFTPEESILIPAPYEKPFENNGSNNWVVSGKLTESGQPILCNDPHLGLNLPSIWFECQLNAPGLNVYGVTIPGAPGIVIGFNENISWGVTNGTQDVKDWYKMESLEISLIKVDGKEIFFVNFFFEDENVSGELIIDTIKVRGSQDSYNYNVISSFGPVAYSYFDSTKNERYDFALRWTAHDPSNEIMTFYELNRAENLEDYKSALKHFVCPSQNFVYADKEGNIAITQQGQFYVKREQQGRFIMDGSKKENEWGEKIRYDQNPQIINPERGFVSSANQIPTDSTYPYYYNGSFENFRNRRINSVLASLNKITIDDMMKLQNDNYSVMAEDILPFMLDSLRGEVVRGEEKYFDDGSKKILTELLKWNYEYDTNEIAPTYFELWSKSLYRILWDELEPYEVFIYRPGKLQTIKFLKNNSQSDFIDFKATTEKEGLTSLLEIALTEVVDTATKYEWDEEKLKWSNYKGTFIQHILRLEPFSKYNLSIGGNYGIVNATGEDHGPSWRMIVSPGEKLEAYGVYPGGQIGNPGSKHYDEFVETWRTAEYFSLWFMKSSDENSEILFSTQKLKAK